MCRTVAELGASSDIFIPPVIEQGCAVTGDFIILRTVGDCPVSMLEMTVRDSHIVR